MIPPSRLVLGPLPGGLQTYDKPFFLNNESFPTLQNALCWRHRLIKKPGSSFLGQLNRKITTVSLGSTTYSTTLSPIPLLHGTSQFFLGSIIFTDSDVTATASVNLTTATGGASGTLNRTTGALTLNFPALAGNTDLLFAPGYPVMGIEEFESAQNATAAIDTPTNVYFDTVYSYLFNSATSLFVDNSFFVSSTALCYWSGANYQQFSSTNYYNAMFVTNNKPGAQFVYATYSAGSGTANVTFNFKDKNGGNNITYLAVNDQVFINEFGSSTVNGLTGIITDNTGAGGGNYIVNFGSSTPTVAGSGIAQLLTNIVNTTGLAGGGTQGDGIRWYDGTGFSNFCPPLTQVTNTSTNTTQYLCGARILIPFGNRLLAIGPFVATSTQIFNSLGTTFAGTYKGNEIIYCEVSATPFYANAPSGQTSVANAWATNIQGFGGFIDLDTTQRIISAAITQSSLILGLEAEQRKVTLTGIETDPFTLQTINPDYGTAGTHSIIPMDKGILTAGEYGFITTSSYDAQRFDLPIIDQIFQIDPDGNGYERIAGGRDFGNEVVYFSYPSIFSPENLSSSANEFPDTTLVYNYRENSFAIWLESATTYGLIKTTVVGATWASLTYLTWEEWNDPWNSSPDSVSTYPYVGFGTPEGYVMLKWANETTNGPSLNIQKISTKNADGTYSITSVNHNLFGGMYLGFFAPSGASTPYIPAAAPSFIGRVAYLGDTSGNNQTTIFAVNFDASIDPSVIQAGTWKMSIIDQPFIQTKQFQMGWSGAKKTRVGAQKYFLDSTNSGEFTVDILTSQGFTSNNQSINGSLPSLISNAIVRTRPDNDIGTNSGQSQQDQIWHRLASSCIGDTIQLQMTFSDAQMRNVGIATSPWVLYSAILDLYPSRELA